MKLLKYSLMVIALVSFAGSCKKQGGKVKIEDDFSLTITHVGCRGYCPAWTVSVDGKGNVLYNGTRNVELMGEHTKNIGVDKVKELIATLDQYKYAEFDAEYGGGVADLPSVKTEVVRGGKTKTIHNIRNAPAALEEMQKKLEDIIGTEGYQPK